jgi:hypothetical protein
MERVFWHEAITFIQEGSLENDYFDDLNNGFSYPKKKEKKLKEC